MKAACQVNVGVNNAVASVTFGVVAVASIAAIASVVAAAFGVVVVVSAIAIGAVAAVAAALLRFKSVPWLLST